MSDTLTVRDTEIMRPSWGLRARAFTAENKLFVIGALIFLAILLATLFATWIAPYSPTKIAFSQKLQPPSLDHFMGTDKFGRDIFSRVLHGGQVSLSVGAFVTLMAILLGSPIGLVAGYFGGKVDTVLMRLSDVFLAFPPLLLPISIVAALGPGLANAMIALAISWFPWYARIMRAAVMRVRKELYIDAARAMGVSHAKVMLRHITPNSLTPIIVQGSMDFGFTILAAASLSFIGLGARPPTIEWGLMAATARTQFLEHWWTALCPGFAIFITVLAVNLIGDGLRDVLDPKHGTSE
jgi:peptide/nickel transport system permease protein